MYTYPWPQGSTHVLLPVTLMRGDGTPIDLTGLTTSSIVLKRRTVLGNQYGALKNCAGAVTLITDATNGQFLYKFGASDVASAGLYELICYVNFGTNDLLVTLPQRLEIISTQ